MTIAGTIAKNSMFTFIAAGLKTITSFVAGILLARYLGTEQYGLYSLMMWFLSLASIIVDLGMGDMVKRYIAEAIGQKNMMVVKGITRLILLVRGVAAIISAIIILCLSAVLAKLFNVPSDGFYFMLVAAMIVPSTIRGSISSIFTGFQKFDYSTYLTMIESILSTSLIIVLLVTGFGVREILFMFIGVSFISIIIGFLMLKNLVPLKDLFLPSLLEPATRKSALKFSIAALAILGVDYFLWQQAEVMFLGIYQPVEIVGFYRMAHRVPEMAISLIPFVLGHVLLPAVSEQYGKGDI
jgi:O-antigen/teichoic acid export membrane protein